MALVSLPEVKALGARTERWQHKSAGSILRESVANFSEQQTYDAFLSHSYSDRTTILGIKQYLEGRHISVFVDWIAAKQLDRTRVTKNTAATLKDWMDHCRCLIYACTPNSAESVWMPWELGYFDGTKSLVAILPLTETKKHDDAYKGREYLGVYPYISDTRNVAGQPWLWINETADRYVRFDLWLQGHKPYDH